MAKIHINFPPCVTSIWLSILLLRYWNVPKSLNAQFSKWINTKIFTRSVTLSHKCLHFTHRELAISLNKMEMIAAALIFDIEEQPKGTCSSLQPMASCAQPPLTPRWIIKPWPVASATSPFLLDIRADAEYAVGRHNLLFTYCCCKWSKLWEVLD